MVANDSDVSFPFMKLPDLVQYLVLTQTDLVPKGSVPIQIASRSRVHSSDHPHDDPIWPRKSTAPSNHISLCACQLCAIQPPAKIPVAIGCACSLWVKGIPKTVTSRWVFPVSIFLISKQINALAKSVFFSQNTFVIWDDSMAPSRLVGTIASEFVYLDLTLRKLRQMPLVSFRWLEFRLESFQALENKKDGISYELWHELANLIHDTTLAGRLTLVIDFSFMNDDYCGSPDGQEDKWEAYQNIAGAFNHEVRLFKDFFLHLASPENSSYEDDHLRWTREQTLEKRVMNNTKYDSAARGKYKQRWLDESSGPRMYFRHVLRSVDLSHLDDHDPEVRRTILDDTGWEKYTDETYADIHICADHIYP